MTTRIHLSVNGSSPFEQLIGHNPEILNKWLQLETAVFSQPQLDAHLLEQVRRVLAFGNACEYCMVKGGKPDFDQNDKRVQYATAFAELFTLDHTSISEEHFDMLKDEFSEQEIAGLCAFMAFISASQKLGRVMNLTESLQANKVTTLSELSNR